MGLQARLGRPYSAVAHACDKALTLADHHDWVKQAAGQLVVGGETLWQAMCAEWTAGYLSKQVAHEIGQQIEDLLLGIEATTPREPCLPVRRRR